MRSNCRQAGESIEMNENQPPEEISEALRKASKLRAMIASPGWQDIILPDLLETKQGLEQELIRTEWNDLADMNKCRYRLLAINEFLDRIDIAIDEAAEIEKESAIKEATGKHE